MRVALLTGAVVLVFCLALVAMKEDPQVVNIDLWNMISFGILSVAINAFLMRTKVRVLIQQRKISYMNAYDLMTGLKTATATSRKRPVCSMGARAASPVFMPM